MSALRTLIGPGEHSGAHVELLADDGTLLPATLRSSAGSDLEVLLCLSGAISVLLTTSPELRSQLVSLLELDGLSSTDAERVTAWLEETFGALTLVKLAANGHRTANALRTLGIGEDECSSS